jgi:hypothetical protein
MKHSALYADILRIHPELRDSPRTHHEVITEPLELSSGLANANIATDENGRPLYWRGKIKKLIDNLPEYTPGTFASVGGKLRKAQTRSTLVQQRWHNPAGPSKVRKLNSCFLRHGPTLKQLEQRREAENDARQREALRALCAARAIAA